MTGRRKEHGREVREKEERKREERGSIEKAEEKERKKEREKAREGKIEEREESERERGTDHEVWEGTEEAGHTAPFLLCVGAAGGFWSELWGRGTPFSLHSVPRGNHTPQRQSEGRPTDRSCL